MLEKKKTNKKHIIGWGALIYLVPISAAIYMSQQETSMCDQFKPYYHTDIQGVVIKKYYASDNGRRRGYIHILSEEGIEYHFDSSELWKVYEQLQLGDSVSKPSESTNFEFYREGELLGGMYWNCEPPE
jgi:hypothetical protein